MVASIELLLGGARSGKTRLAQGRAAESGLEPVYLATATAGDAAMQQRIAHHRRDRATDSLAWTTIEEPLQLGPAIREHLQAGRCLVVDCLTLWLSNCLQRHCWPEQRTAFLDALQSAGGQTDGPPGDRDCRLILVSNETGLGVVPMGALTRDFVDASGRLHQQIACLADAVSLVVAGLPLNLK